MLKNNMIILIDIYSYDSRYIEKYIDTLKTFLYNLGLLKNKNHLRIINLSDKNEKITILKSPHVNKNARDQFIKKIKRKKIKLFIPITLKNKNNELIFMKISSILRTLSTNVQTNVQQYYKNV